MKTRRMSKRRKATDDVPSGSVSDGIDYSSVLIVIHNFFFFFLTSNNLLLVKQKQKKTLLN